MAHLEDIAEEDFNVTPMFGDPFGNRGDYSKGIFYSGRRRFLHGQRDENHLQPPEIFMTKEQKKRHTQGSEGGGLNLKRFDFVDKAEVAGEKIKSSKKDIRKAAKSKKKNNITFIEKYSTTERENWVETMQAGCKLYINHATGEVSDECPWDEASNKLLVPGSPESLRPMHDRYEPIIEEDEPTGTGNVVYEGGELDEVLRMMDAAAAKEKELAGRRETKK
jgi:hypothetical protein